MRNSTTIEKVREYHKQYYRPENLLLTITGRIEEDKLFEVIRPIEEKILQKREIEGETEYQRPWSQKPDPTGFDADYVFQHEFPDEDVDKAHVIIAWRLEDHISDHIPMLEAYELMFKYLTSSKVSPFQADFVQSDDPIASGVGFFSYKYSFPSLGLKFANVPTNRTKEIIPRMEKVVKQVLTNGADSFDLVRIHDYINTGLLKNLKENENSPHSFVPDATLLDKLYGLEPQHFKEYVVSTQWSSRYLEKNASYWLDLIDDIFNRHFYVAVEGIPSLELSKNITTNEANRIEKQIETLGEEGLKRKAEELAAALDSQTLPGDDVLEKIPLGDVNQIQFRHILTYNRTHNTDNLIDFSSIPLKIQIEDVKSSFVTIYIYIDITKANLSIKERKYLPLFVDMWTKSPMIKNGTITDIDGVIKRYNKVLISYEMSQAQSYMKIGGQAKLNKLSEAVNFIHDRINYPYFTEDDLKKTVYLRLNKGTPKASSIKSQLLDGIYYSNETLDYYTGHLAQKNFLTELKNQIEDGQAQTIIEDLYKMLKKAAQSNHSFIHAAGNVRNLVEKYDKTLSVFSKIFNVTNTVPDENFLRQRYDVIKDSEYRDENKTRPQHVALGVDSTSSCYMSQTVLYNNTDWSLPEVRFKSYLKKITPSCIFVQYPEIFIS